MQEHIELSNEAPSQHRKDKGKVDLRPLAGHAALYIDGSTISEGADVKSRSKRSPESSCLRLAMEMTKG